MSRLLESCFTALSTSCEKEYLPLSGRTIVVGVAGSVAAPKSFQVVSLLVKLGAAVEVVMSKHAHHFIGPWAFEGITGVRPTSCFFSNEQGEHGENHLRLARKADAMLVVPATDSFLSHLAAGIPHDALTLVAKNLDCRALMVAPAMSNEMWTHPATGEVIDKLKSWGVEFVGPVEGRLADGARGMGRMAEPEEIVAHMCAHLGRRFGKASGLKVVVSAGGSKEPIDAVRLLTNKSSGLQGIAIAEAARDQGAHVTLVLHGDNPFVIDSSYASVIKVQTHSELQHALAKVLADADIYVGAAAVADFTCEQVESGKISRASDTVTLTLKSTADIIGGIEAQGLLKVAFAAETSFDFEKAQKKRKRKGAELLVLNDVSAPGAGFGTSTNRVAILGDEGTLAVIPDEEGSVAGKYQVARRLLELALPLTGTVSS